MSCVKGYKISGKPIINNLPEGSDIIAVEPEDNKLIVEPEQKLTKKLKKNVNKKAKLFNKEFKNHEEIVKRLNSVEKTWTAGVSKDFDGLSLHELNKRAGFKREDKFRQNFRKH